MQNTKAISIGKGGYVSNQTWDFRALRKYLVTMLVKMKVAVIMTPMSVTHWECVTKL
jgi:hypothetical protein